MNDVATGSGSKMPQNDSVQFAFATERNFQRTCEGENKMNFILSSELLSKEEEKIIHISHLLIFFII